MQIPVYQVDAFSYRPFSGNPAAVCPLDAWLPDDLLQSIAMENNLAETAFFVPNGDAFELRWFTPAVEVALCGHATLATAAVLFDRLAYAHPTIHFDTRSGRLSVSRTDDLIVLDFPSLPPTPCTVPAGLAEAMGGSPIDILASRDYLVIYGTAQEVRDLQPNMQALHSIDRFAVIATAPGPDPATDFVSRFFAPAKGVPEDPVTGSAHCTLIPYWAGRLGKTKMRAVQVSARGGELFCELNADRVSMAGRATFFLEGTITIQVTNTIG